MGDMADMYDDYGPDWLDGDEYEMQTNGRIWSDKGKPTCANCDSTNIKTSKAGNLYCADLCWLEDDQN